MDYENKTVIVTGGAQGIGRGIAEAYAAKKAKVIIADVNVEKGIALQEEIRVDRM